ncbi:phosphoadenosine phosphosulfate reductase domain-containing protein [Nocardia arizonensis]|uniref:phosphoadenosine phosphosulfate reductase domain-containing protein n=2 Tax=Nocardia TaxID=1817 RepID=UPI0009E94E96|nr:phosphoadenosine phosphosulfate reductase family protein [Nocardia arizonensis]
MSIITGPAVSRGTRRARRPVISLGAVDFSLAPGPDLLDYDHYLLSLSSGKDSQAMADVLVEVFHRLGVLDRVTTVHADLGRVDWPETSALAREHAEYYGLRHEVVARTGGDLLDRVTERGKWPSHRNRWCTSDFKRSPARRVITMLVAESRAAGIVDRPIKVLHAMGHRAQESRERSRRPAFVHEPGRTCPCPSCAAARADGNPPKGGVSNSRRIVDTWLPIHAWDLATVWARIAAAGTRPHSSYRAGFGRASCVFCIYSSRSGLVRAARLHPELAAQYAAVEAEIGHRFRVDVSMAEVIADAASDTGAGVVADRID